MGRDLRALVHPDSVAIIGASPRNITLQYMLRYEYPGHLYPVNPKYREIAGLTCYPGIGAVPGPVDLAVISVPARAVPAVVEECIAKRVGAMAIISSGFAELGPEGAALQARVRDLVKASGIPTLGPNCVGMVNAPDRVPATISQAPGRGMGQAVPVAFISQSGAFGTSVSALAASEHLGFSYFMNTGNEADLECGELAEYLLDDPRVQMIAGYLEGLRDGPAFLRAARKAVALRKPLAFVKVGRSDSGKRAAASHTGSMTGADEVYDTVFRQYGVIRLRDEVELLDVVALYQGGRLPPGNRVAVVTMSGGAGVLMSDECSTAGLTVPELSPATQAALRALLPPFAACGNPVDLTGQFVLEPSDLARVLRKLLDEASIDNLVCYMNLMDTAWPRVVEALRQVHAGSGKPVAVVWILPPEEAKRQLSEAGIPLFPSPGRCIRALGHLARYSTFLRRGGLPEAEEPPVAGTGSGERRSLTEVQARAALAPFGLPVPREAVATSPQTAAAAAEALGFPVVAKLLSPDILHKTEAGGVRVGIGSAAEAAAAYEAVMAAARAYRPEARLEGVLLQEQVAGVAEMIIGVVRDAVFGPVLLCGLGGIMTEVFRDVSRRRLPVSRDEAEAMLRELRGFALLTGARGRPRADLGAVVEALLAVSRYVEARGVSLLELDINPLIVLPEGHGARAVDVLIVEESR